MGWRSAANLFQHLHAQLARSAALQVPAVDLPSWLGRATPAAGLDERGCIVHFVRVYLDNWDKGRLTTALEAAKSTGRLGPLQQALRDTFKARGVARSEKKAVVEQSGAVTLGADFLGDRGRSKPTTVKACQLCCWTWRAWADDPVEERVLGAVLGQACFFGQFRRPAFSVLLHAWHAADEESTRPRRQVVFDELFGFLCLLPLMQIDFHQVTSPVINCSDASEQGAGVSVARALSGDGVEALMRRLAPVQGLFDKSVGLMESFAGIASTRVALHLMGVRPALHMASEILETAINVTMHNWPDCIQLGAIEDVDRVAFRMHAHKAPTLELMLHTAGSPCPGLCTWNPFRHRGLSEDRTQHAQSEELFLHVRRVTLELEADFEGVIVHEPEEIVCTMTNEQRDILSRELGRTPYRLGLSDLSENRRWRYRWPSWQLRSRPQVELEERDVTFKYIF